VVLVSSLFEKRATGLYHNTAVVFEKDGSTAGKYRKMHIPDDPGFYEKFYFTPGDIGFEPIDTSVGRLGVMVCWDQWYPEGARLMALAGAELLLYPTAIGWDPEDEQARRTASATPGSSVIAATPSPMACRCCRAIASGMKPRRWDVGIQFWGSSHVLGPQGEFLAEANQSEPEILLCEVDMERSEHVRASGRSARPPYRRVWRPAEAVPGLGPTRGGGCPADERRT
jgi:N-carbamoylputrescine amidase